MTEDPTKSAESLPVVVTSAPERIFLIIGEECPLDSRWDQLAEVLWCEDDIDGNGIAYVRADQIDALRVENERLRDRLKMLRNHTSVSENQIAMIDDALKAGKDHP